jgi:hypothetical protein
MFRTIHRSGCSLLLAMLLLSISVSAVGAQTTSFTYQGRLTTGGAPASGIYDLQFVLWDSSTGGTQSGETQTVPTVAVSAGIFSVELDFGANAFSGATRFLEINAKSSGAASFTTLSPRQPLTSTPYAIRSLASASADTAANATLLGGVAGSQYVQTNDARLTDPRTPTAGSGNYIQNTTTLQAGANLNISGNGLVGGNVGIGTTSPAARLHVANASGSGAGLFVEASEGDRAAMYYSPNTGVVLDSFRPGDGRRLPFLLQPNGGNVGIGTANPQTRLEVQNSGYGITHTDGTSRLSTLIFPGGDAWFGTSTNHPLYLFANSTRVLGISTSGNVGIGTDSPQHHLTILGGPAWTSNQWAGAVELSNASAIAWRANAGGQRFGIGQSAGGLYFFRSSSDPGTTGSPATYDMQISDAGNVGIGKAPSAGTKLDVLGGVLISPGNGGTMQFATPNAETGMSNIFGAGRADVRFDGTTLKLVAGPVGFVPPSTNGIVVHTSGSVGIGTTTPTQGRLQVNGGSLNGVYGSSAFKGVWGESPGNLGIGVYGLGSAIDGYGLYGIATGANGIGVYGQGNRYGGYFSGAVHITGNLSKGGGAFQIDHPLDPANKYLSHSFVESPDMMNIYNGNVTTDSNGDATITLPDYMVALNRDFRYQLTVIGQFAQAIVSTEIKNNRFTIKTDKPQIKVSWQVTGIRQDAYANANRIRVEEDKPETERGYYLHPRAFGELEEKGVEWARDPAGMKQRKEEQDRAREQSTKADSPAARP